MTKKVNKKDYARLQDLNARVCDVLIDPTTQSMHLYRGDLRAIQWAAWWIRETLKAETA